MMCLLLIILTFLMTYVVATPHRDDLAWTLTARQTAASPVTDCTITCNHSRALIQQCGDVNPDPSCICQAQRFQSRADCLGCRFRLFASNSTARGMSLHVLRLEAVATSCRDLGFTVTFTVQLPPETQALVDDSHRQDARLRQRQTTFLALQIAGGHVGLVITLGFTLFSRNAYRDPTFFNCCLTWICSSIFYSILLYRGTAGNTAFFPLRNIPLHTCVTQAALANGAQVMTACSTMALVIQLWIGLRGAIYGDSFYGARYRRWTTITFLAFPYVLFLSFALPSVFVGSSKELLFGTLLAPRALPTTFYCAITHRDSFSRTIYAVTLGLLTITAVFDACIVILLFRHWKAFRKTRTKNPVSLSIFFRVKLFNIYRIIVAITYGTVLDTPPTPNIEGLVHDMEGTSMAVISGVPILVDMLQAAIPLVAFLALGLNSEMLSTLMFWRKGPAQATANEMSEPFHKPSCA